jgi:hypothetical protein
LAGIQLVRCVVEPSRFFRYIPHCVYNVCFFLSIAPHFNLLLGITGNPGIT